jgi:adenylate kinase
LCQTRAGIPHLSTGAIFREEIANASPLGRRVQRYVLQGRLVPDALVIKVMAGRLAVPSVEQQGFVVDGFPRTRGQAVGLDRILARLAQPLDGAVYLTAPRGVLIRRLSGRRVCERCGANFHVRTMRPRRPGRCDACGGGLIIRRDDAPATIRKRLTIDAREASPLVAYYRRRGLLYPIDGTGSVETVFLRWRALVRRTGWRVG